MNLPRTISSLALILGTWVAVGQSLQAQAVFQIDSVVYCYGYPSFYPNEHVTYRNNVPEGRVTYFAGDGGYRTEYWLSCNQLIGVARQYRRGRSLAWEIDFGSLGPPTWEKYCVLPPPGTQRQVEDVYMGDGLMRSRNGLRDGMTREYFGNGLLSKEMEWVAGERTGIYRTWQLTPDEQGTRLSLSGHYLHGLQEGEWEVFEENGIPSTRSHYHRDTLHGLFESFDSLGRRSSATHFNMGKRDSIDTDFYENGRPKSRRYYEADGIWCTEENYFPNGQIASRGRRHEWAKQGEWLEYDSLGTLLTQGEFFAGYKQGEWKRFRPQCHKMLTANFDHGMLLTLAYDGHPIPIQEPIADTTAAQWIVFFNFPADESLGFGSQSDEMVYPVSYVEPMPTPVVPEAKVSLPARYDQQHPLQGSLLLMGDRKATNIQFKAELAPEDHAAFTQQLTQMTWHLPDAKGIDRSVVVLVFFRMYRP